MAGISQEVKRQKNTSVKKKKRKEEVKQLKVKQKKRHNYRR
jgi:hypothetical protein